MKQPVLVGSKVFSNGKWEYLMDPDDNYFMDEAEYHRQKLEQSDDDPPVYICYCGKHIIDYTYNDLLVACNLDMYLTDFIFENLMGEVPEDLLDEYLSSGKVIQCPHCAKYITREEDGRWDYV